MSDGMWTIRTRVKTYLPDHARRTMFETAGTGFVAVSDFNAIRQEYEQALAAERKRCQERAKELERQPGRQYEAALSLCVPDRNEFGFILSREDCEAIATGLRMGDKVLVVIERKRGEG